MISNNEIFINKLEEEFTITGINLSSDGYIVEITSTDTMEYIQVPLTNFSSLYRMKSGLLKKKNINNDIIKLIESGYEFKSFYGSTFDGKEFHIEVED